MIKSLIIIIVTFVVVANACSQPLKEKLFAETVKYVITFFSKQDSAGLAKYISGTEGAYVLYRGGAFENYRHLKTVSFAVGFPLLPKEVKNISLLPLQYAKLPEWNCDSEAWTKIGLFVDTLKEDHFLSKICIDRNKYVPDSIPKKTIDKYHRLESISRRIVLQDKSRKEIVFYLSYIKGKWYLTIIDKASSDCSA